MKKAIIYAAALFIATIAFAQRPQPVEKKDKQSQEFDDADQGSNFSQIDQVGIGGKANVFQQGEENASYIMQTGTSKSNGNEAYLYQESGDDLTSSRNYGDFVQNGAGNKSTIAQYGDDHVAFADQDGTDNLSDIVQGTWEVANSDLLYGEVIQTGDNNTGKIYQQGVGNTAVSKQYSEEGTKKGNYSYQEQGGMLKDYSNTAFTNQAGSKNKSVQRQFNDTPDVVGNYVEVNQGDVATKDLARDSYSEQFQSGFKQEAYITQRLESNEAYQEQIGVNNKVIAEQNANTSEKQGGKNFSIQDQNGEKNTATLRQRGYDHESFQQQIGFKNDALTAQLTGSPSNGNSATALQHGSENSSAIRQGSFRNMSFVDQMGTGHKSVVKQNMEGANRGNIDLSGSNSVSVIQRNQGQSLDKQSLIRTRSTISRF